MEGDFTEIYIEITGHKRKIYLWVCSLPFSNSYFATPYYHCNFECFADGSVKAFNEFGGVAKKYRLDNMSVAVKKILMGKNRIVTARYAELQEHYGFSQDFCNPARGNEKGNVEANNRFLKRKYYPKFLSPIKNLLTLMLLKHLWPIYAVNIINYSKVSLAKKNWPLYQWFLSIVFVLKW
jgi:transposase